MKKSILTLITLLYANIIFSQISRDVFFYTENEKELVFYLKENPNTIAFILPKTKPILSIQKTKLVKKTQKLGSIKLKWKDSRKTDYYYNNYDLNDNSLILKSKNDTIKTKIFIYQLDKNNYQTRFEYSNQRKIVNYDAKDYIKTIWNIPLLKNEDVYGGGEQFSFVNVKGQKIQILTEEQGIGRGDEPISSITRLGGAAGNKTTTFMPIANFVTSNRRVINNDFYNSNFREIDFRKKDCIIWSMYSNETITTHNISITIPKNNKWDLVQEFEPQPAFMFKTILGLQGGTDTVLQKLKILTDAGVKPSALWIQDWCGRRITPFGKQLYWNWQLDSLRYNGFKKFQTDLKARNIKLLGYMNPFLAEGTPLAKQCIAIEDTAENKGGFLLIKSNKLKPVSIKVTGFKAHLFDFEYFFTDVFIQNLAKKELIDKGFSGWMADFGEWSPISNLHNTACEDIDFHNEYPNQWAKLQMNIKNETIRHNKDTLGIFMRSSTRPSGHIYWAGDQNTNWGKNDGLPSLVPALLSSGLSGIGINHGDIGGFTSFKKPGYSLLRNRELLYRWIELCAFTPVFRTHEGLAPDHNLQVYSDVDAARFFAKFSVIHDSLHGYIMRTYHEIQTEHLPMVRHLVIKYPDDLNVRSLDYQFMFGNDILVIPVLEKGAKTVRGYLPTGTWQHFFTKEIIKSKGEWRVFDAPLGQPCVWRAME